MSDRGCIVSSGQDGEPIQSPVVGDKAALICSVRDALDRLPEGSADEREWLDVALEVLEDPEAHEDDLTHVLEDPLIADLHQQAVGTCEQR